MKNVLLFLLAVTGSIWSSADFENVWQLEGKWQYEPNRANEKYLDDVYNIDVQSYSLSLDVSDSTTKVARCNVVVTAKTTTGNFQQAILDFYRKSATGGFNIAIDSIFYSDAVHTNYLVNLSSSVDWSDNKRIKITLPASLNTNEQFSLRFVYSGTNMTVDNPDLWELGLFYKIVSNKAVIQSLSCPEGSGAWFPCKDLPSDKVLCEFKITTWPHQKAVANGKLLSETELAGNRKFYHWQTNYPVSTYLMFFTVSSFKVYEQSYTSLDSTKQMPVLNYLYPSTYNSSLNGLSQYPEMIKALALKLGEYPFINEKAGNVSYVLGGGMEHQTIPAIQSSSFTEMLLLHELSHQWIGDQSTCKTWNDAWINEGGASYCEALWKEYKLGFPGYKSWMNGFKSTATSTSANKPLYGYLPTFGSVIYHKGAWIYHMLRYVLGDDVYFAAQKKLLSQSAHSYANVGTDEFFDFFSQESGKNLNWFKDQWVLKGGFPKYSVGYLAVGSVVRFQVKQTQTVTAQIPIFKMPVPVRVVYEDNSDTLLVLNDSLALQEFVFNLPKPVKTTMLIADFNYDEKVLCSKTLVPYVGIEDSYTSPIRDYKLTNYPNPFNNSALISYNLPSDKEVEISVYNAKGEMVRTLFRGLQTQGRHNLTFDAAGLNSGVYYLRLKDRDANQILKCLLVK